MVFQRLFQGAIAGLCVCGAVFAAAGSGVWLDVPFIKQEKDGCGAASIAMVMQYWQRQSGSLPGGGSDPAEIQRVLYSAKAHGIYASDMAEYFRKHHFRVYAFRGEWNDLKENLAKGRPLIVALQPLPGEPALHYVVVAGVDWGEDVVLMNDAARRKLFKVDRASFIKEWKAVDNWTLLAVPEPPG